MSKSLSLSAFVTALVLAAAAFVPARAQETKETPAPVISQAAPGDQLVYVRLTTTKGPIVLELNETKAPISTANFLAYVDKGFYDGTIFHRVIPNFMIQGGGFTAEMKQKATEAPIKNEWKNGLKNKRGAIAMARTQVADSATSQFFINVQDNPMLDQPRDGAAYAVFGDVVEGMEVVDAIKVVPTGRKGPHSDVPLDPVIIEKAERLPEYKKS